MTSPSPVPRPAGPLQRVAPRQLGRLRRALATGTVRLMRVFMPAFVKLAGEECWDCGKRIVPPVKMARNQIVEARLWAWEEVVCDQCVRSRLTRFGGKGPKH